MCFFFTLNIVLKKESQPKKIVCKIMNFGSTNWLKNKKVRNTIDVTIFSQYLYFSYGGP